MSLRGHFVNGGGWQDAWTAGAAGLVLNIAGRRTSHRYSRYGGTVISKLLDMIAVSLLLAAVTGSLEAARPPIQASASPDSVERARMLHLLNRITYGPRPGDIDRLARIGIERFVEEQLHPESIPDRAAVRVLSEFRVLKLGSTDYARAFTYDRRMNLERQRRRPDTSNAMRFRGSGRGNREYKSRLRPLLVAYQQATLTRAVVSERQLYEIMVDFWTNHFNVFMGKGADRYLTPAFIEDAIRPNALGRFSDLLIATARSPAMLFYLDNFQSVRPGAEPPDLSRLKARASRGRAMRRARVDSLIKRVMRRLPRGINENYARELMELHTLGVDGGYTQEDVIAVARILTGWSIDRPGRGGGHFVFNAWAHDRNSKTVLGRDFPAGRDMSEGIELLEMLANHPATMRHVSTKLCRKFVSDTPDAECIDRAVDAWKRSRGEIAEVVRAIITGPSFWNPLNYGTKVKTPLEFLVSAIRATDVTPDTLPGMAHLITRLGQPLFLQPAPTGYPESQSAWISSGALLDRMNVALALASGKAPGLGIRAGEITGAGPLETMIERVNNTILNGTASSHTLRVMLEQTSDLPASMQQPLLVALALGSPEFQKQ